MKYGLSLSECVRDMALGHVNPAFVIKIFAGTAHEPKDDSELRVIIERYKSEYWSDCAEQAERIFREFWAAGKVSQPRLIYAELPDLNASGGHWVDTYDEIRWIRDHFMDVTID